MARILVIDDEDLVRLTMRQALKKVGHEIVEAENGVVGLTLFGEGGFDLVFCDIIMPKKEGIQTIIDIRKIDRDVPIVAMSGGGRTRNTDFLEAAATLGANQTMPKPFDRAQLLAVTASFLPNAA